MKLSDWLFVLFYASLITLVFGYGHELAEHNFLKFMCVLAWAASIGVFVGFTVSAVDEYKRLGK